MTVVERRRVAPTLVQMYPKALRDKDLALLSKPLDVCKYNELESITATGPTAVLKLGGAKARHSVPEGFEGSPGHVLV